ncbi:MULTISPECIES: hypothetical protein [Rhizobium]|uniref:Restriction endonuclease type IV Mrr domain-containing protein n=2 Tax=Rhizobium/Agrobacterium group TaxID=227290 RepID=B3Q236_RHIE6|nr:MULTISPECIES: hypothetical protein [Rhizobium]ACE93742.1 hypothetical protein RHECIAT_PB0000017 [Rhizobium etli CIAT 652]ANK94038.1 hypothetical protein AMK01_PB00019 [Rhizobium sp. N6212]ANL00089.1 hypothetical protein AMK00_PB00019 [Rhizobium sp. N621]ANL06218.1 hypothetical protein AMJ99_PB00019 [Rhizobium esperanzae]ANL12383.1 hypothetical protein AMJ98_PC00019 [Rhizobium sp. N1341]
MGRMKELMIEYRNQEADFMELAEQILKSNGYQWLGGRDPENYDPADQVPYDWKMRGPDGNVTLVDVKIYRSNQLDQTLVWNGLQQLSIAASYENIQHVAIVTNIELSPDVVRSGMYGQYHFDLLDFRMLRDMAHSEEELDQLYQAAAEFRDETWATQPFRPTPPKDSFDADEAKRKLRECPVGDGPKYEQACEYAIRGVFANDFNPWSSKQHKIADGFHRLDLLGHINSQQDFWKGLRYDFRTRYVVFEFKNYAERITQKEIYTTEKYLFAGALRMIAIIIARNGEDAGAKAAREGALREHGKLIILLTGDELINIIGAFRAGDDVHGLLLNNLHNMLSVIGR